MKKFLFIATFLASWLSISPIYAQNVAQIGSTNYESLAAAIEAVPTDGTATSIKMLKTDNVTSGITIASTKNVVLNLNGKDITGSVNGKLITNAGTLTISGSGHIYNQDVSAQGHDAVYNTGTLVINNGVYADANNTKTDANAINRGAAVRNYGGTATIYGGSFTACDNFTNGGYAYALINDNNGTMTIYNANVYGKNNGNIANNYGTVTVWDGTYTLNNASNYYSLYVDGEDGRATTIVKGGSFTNTTNSGLLHTSDATNASVEIDGGSFTYTTLTNQTTPALEVSGGSFSTDVSAYIESGSTVVQNGDGSYVINPVAQIGETKYASLAAAVAAVPTDGTQTTITMIANEMINVVGYAITIPATKNVVLDLNGFQVVGTVEQEGTSALIRNLGTLTIKDSSDTNEDGTGTGKLMSGANPTWTWDGTDDYSGSYASNLIRNEKNLIIESGLLYNMSTGSASYAIDNYSAGNVTINGGKVDAAKASAVRMFYVDGGSITVTGGVVGHYTSDTDYSYMGIQVMGGTNANVSVTGGTIAGMYALYAGNSGGNMSINGGTFNGEIGSSNITGFISGGTFNEPVNPSLCASGMKCVEDNGKYIIVTESDPRDPAGEFVYYYWYDNNQEKGETCALSTPFTKGWLCDGEYIRLLTNITMTEDIACLLASGTFTLTQGTYTITGGYHISLLPGVSVVTDKQTDIFSAATEGYKVVEDVHGDGYIYTTVEITYVAQIGTTKYETLEEAVAAATAGQTITLLADVDLSNHARSASDDIVLEGVTLDLNEHTIRGFNSGVRYSGNNAVIKNGTFDFVAAEPRPNYGLSIGSYTDGASVSNNMVLEDLTVIGGINIDLANVTLNNVDIDMDKSTFYAIWVDEDGSNVTFNSGTINAGSDATAVFGVAMTNASLKITGGTINTNGEKFRLEGGYMPVEVSGGVFDTPVPEDCCAEGYIPTDLGNGKYGVKVGSYVAQVGTTKYETLQAAIDAATAGASIDILTDFDLTTIASLSSKYNVDVNKSLTINGNNHTVTASSGKRAFALSGTGNNIIINDLTIVNNGALTCMCIWDAVTCTLNNVTIDGTNYGEGYNQPLMVYTDEGRATININNSTIKTNDAGSAHYAVILWTPTDLTITNSTIKGWANVYIKPGAAGSVVNVSGSTLVSQGISGDSNSFAMYTTESGNNTITLTDNSITTTAQGSTYNSLLLLNGNTGNTINLRGDQTTFTTNDVTYGGLVMSNGDIEGNTITLDAATNTIFAAEVAALTASGVTETEDNGIYTLNYTSEVYYYWIANGNEEGVNADFAEPFTNGWLANGEFIRLKKDVTLTANVACQLTSGSFTLTQGAFAVTKGEYSVSLKAGVSVHTDKQTDIFTAEDNTYKVVGTQTADGYTYTLVVKPMDEQDIVLTDEEAYTITTDTPVKSATYVRNVPLANTFCGWYVPFNYTITAEDAENMTFYKINLIANAAEGEEEVTSNDKIWINLTKMNANDVLYANRPYVFKSTETGEHTFTTNNATLLAKDNSSRLNCSSTAYNYDFYGNYAMKGLTKADHAYYVDYYGDVSWPDQQTISIKPYRWYILVTPKNNSGNNYYAPVFVFMEDDDDATGIKLEGNNLTGESYYNLNGMRINKPASGAYIIKYSDGTVKKVIK